MCLGLSYAVISPRLEICQKKLHDQIIEPKVLHTETRKLWLFLLTIKEHSIRGGVCPSRQSRRECKIFASGVNFSIFTHFLCFFLLKLLKLGEIDGVKFLAWKSGGVKFWTNSMSGLTIREWPLQSSSFLDNSRLHFQMIVVVIFRQQWSSFLDNSSFHF